MCLTICASEVRAVDVSPAAAELTAQIREAFIEMAENYKQQSALWLKFETHMLCRAEAEDFAASEWATSAQQLQQKLNVRNMRDNELHARVARLRAERELPR